MGSWIRKQNMHENAGGTAKTIQWLNQLDPEARKRAIVTVEQFWRHEDSQSLADYLLNPAGQDAGPDIKARAARSLAYSKPVEAIEWVSHVKSENGDQVLIDPFGGWIRAQPDSAMQWLGKLPADYPRRERFYLGAVKDSLQSAPFPLIEGANGNHSPDPALALARDLARQLATNPAAPRTTLKNLPLPAPVRAKALTRLGL